MEPTDDRIINVLISTFSGLSLPPTLAIAIPASTPLQEVYNTILSRLPSPRNARYVLTTPNHNDISTSPSSPLSTLLPSPTTSLLSLRLSVPLCGGKGGFGSQLRAAGGRMSKRRKKDGNENGSSRNLDGRRLRTINEAKALAEYLAIKPDMDKKVKEERRKRWADIVESSERREEEIRNQGRNGKGRVSEQWLEDKEEAATRTREAVLRAMRRGESAEMEDESESDGEDDEEDKSGDAGGVDNQAEAGASGSGPGKSRKQLYVGFDDEDDEFMSDDSENEGTSDSKTSVEEEEDSSLTDKGKNKAMDAT